MQRTVIAGLVAATFIGGPAVAEPIVLKLNSPAPPSVYLHTDVMTPWAEAVTADSNGTLKVETYYGGQLGGFPVNYDRVVDGVADIGFILSSFAGGQFKRLDVAQLPFETEDGREAATAMWALYERGLLDSEFQEVIPLAIWTFPNAAIHSQDPVATLADMKDEELATSNVVLASAVEALGGTPLTFRPDEAYQVISRGTATGAAMPFTGMQAFKIYEVTKHHLDVALGSATALLFMNKAKYESLPDEAKAAIDKNSFLGLSQRFGQKTTDEWAKSRAFAAGLEGHTVTVLAPDEAAIWKEKLAPIAETWAAEAPDGEAILAAFREEIEKARAGN